MNNGSYVWHIVFDNQKHWHLLCEIHIQIVLASFPLWNLDAYYLLEYALIQKQFQ